jgi:amino acid transporter
MAKQDEQQFVRVEDYVKGELSKETNWWGAFVVGLAGTILVTGVTPAVLGRSARRRSRTSSSGRSPAGCSACTWPSWPRCSRTGPAARPAYAYYAFKDRLPKAYPHINGVTVWMYWLGWMPVMAVNMILIGAYVPALFGFEPSGWWGNTVQLFDASLSVTYFTIVVGAVLSVLLFFVAYLGIKFGTGAATVLGLLSMIPLTLIAVVPFFSGDVTGSNIWPPTLPDGTAFFSGTAFYLFLQFSALYTWNAIAMEAAACYIGETRNPDRDAPIAMNLSGGYGTFIYTFLPMAVLGVLGVTFIQKSLDPNAILVETAVRTFGSGVSKIVTSALIIALLLSSLNAIMGCARSLYMMALDGQAPRIFGKVNRHNVPDFSMGLNTVLNILLIFVGAPGSIYVLSNVGYVGSFVPGAARLLLPAPLAAGDLPAVQAPGVGQVRRARARGSLLLRVGGGHPGLRDRGLPARRWQDVHHRGDHRAPVLPAVLVAEGEDRKLGTTEFKHVPPQMDRV